MRAPTVPAFLMPENDCRELVGSINMRSSRAGLRRRYAKSRSHIYKGSGGWGSQEGHATAACRAGHTSKERFSKRHICEKPEPTRHPIVLHRDSVTVTPRPDRIANHHAVYPYYTRFMRVADVGRRRVPPPASGSWDRIRIYILLIAREGGAAECR